MAELWYVPNHYWDRKTFINSLRELNLKVETKLANLPENAYKLDKALSYLTIMEAQAEVYEAEDCKHLRDSHRAKVKADHEQTIENFRNALAIKKAARELEALLYNV